MFEAFTSELKKIGNLDAFCTSLRLPNSELSLSVDPVGSIALPISERMAKALIVEAELAKFGLKDQTLLDQEIRNTWVIEKSRIQTNPQWEKTLNSSLEIVRDKLGLPSEGQLSAELHNFLIYMPGQFFKSHQDSEKADGMLATLIVLLPSEFTGGELIVDQHGDKLFFESNAETRSNLTLIAFYADCYHEVKEVKSGFRFALTYNLFFKFPPFATKSVVSNPKLKAFFCSYFFNPSPGKLSDVSKTPTWLVYLLDHQYTQSSLAWENLRGADRENVHHIVACAEGLGLTTHLALADIHETWGTEDDSYYGFQRRNRWNDLDDRDDSSESENYRLVELINDEIELRHWIDFSGRKLDQRRRFVGRDNVCWTKSVDECQPFKSEYEGFMGNYGNTLDRWYHRAAIILWKKNDELVNTFICDHVEAIHLIENRLKENLGEGQAALREILPYWPAQAHRIFDSQVILKLAVLVSDDELASKLLNSIGFAVLSEPNMDLIESLIDKYGEEWALDLLNEWQKLRGWDRTDFEYKSLYSLVQKLSPKYFRVGQWLIESQFSKLMERDSMDLKTASVRDRKNGLKERFDFARALLLASTECDEDQTHESIAQYLMKYPKLYPPSDVVELFFGLEVKHYVQFFSELDSRVSKELQAPRNQGDWSITEHIPHDCRDCEYLKNFLSSSTTQRLVWPLAKDRRQHIHQIVSGMDIPVKHETLHQGSPHKLILTKTPELFEKSISQTKVIEKSLAKLRGLKGP
jgi:hypothetical protein